MVYYRQDCSENKSNWQGRIKILLAVIFIVGVGLVVRLFQQGVINHGKYVALAAKQHVMEEEKVAKRGEIYTKDYTSGELYPIGSNEESYSVNVIPKNIRDARTVAKELAEPLGIDEEEIYSKINNQKLYIPPIKKNVDQGVYDKISNLNLVGVLLTPEYTRIYPEKELASQVLGFVNSDGDGKYGLEGYYNKILKGESGVVTAIKDAKSTVISQDENSLISNGASLVLSIDHNLQYMVEQKLSEAISKYQVDNGSIIIMDPQTGAILAMAGSPSYDPNNYNEVAKNNQNLFINPAISNAWEPGSILKPMVMAAAVDTGKVEPETEDVFSNMTVVQGYEIRTAQDKAFGRETMTQVLENSDNVAMVWVANKFGNEEMNKYFEKFGFRQKTGIDLGGEASGSLAKVENWRDINRATMSFGQGISLTPLQVLVAYAAIANGGKLVEPHVVDKIIEANGTEVPTQTKILGDVISQETASKITGMLVSVVERGHGKKAKIPGFSVAGKTGTAQIPNPEGGYYEDRHTGSFAGFFPADNPRFAMIVRLENPKNVDWAESSAAPTFGEIGQWLVNYYQLSPTQ